MPARNQTKEYSANSYYHLYNRGVGKMNIFHDNQDFSVMLYYLRIVLSPLESLQKELADLETKKRSSNSPLLEAQTKRLQHAVNKSVQQETFENVKLLSFSLMPNHFHLVVYQKTADGIEHLMRRIATGYSMFYKKKYDWVGPVVQGRYNASLLNYDPKLQTIVAACYTERNALDLISTMSSKKRSSQMPSFGRIEEYPYSSLKFYHRELKRGIKPPNWLDTQRLWKIFTAIKERPNSVLEENIAQFDNLLDYYKSGIDISLEDIRFMHLDAS